MPSNRTCDERPLVCIVDDEDAIRTSLSSLLRSAGFAACTVEGTATSNASEKPDRPSCLLLDVRLQGESGLYFQQKATEVHRMPFIFMTGFPDIGSCLRAMKAGASDFLLKPLSDHQVIESVTAAIAEDGVRLRAERLRTEWLNAYQSLTHREREALVHVFRGAKNKQIAAELGIGDITVKVHRAAAMPSRHCAQSPPNRSHTGQ
ncbi:MAG: response regulator transcription factor [Pseudomonadales bacterium]